MAVCVRVHLLVRVCVCVCARARACVRAGGQWKRGQERRQGRRCRHFIQPGARGVPNCCPCIPIHHSNVILSFYHGITGVLAGHTLCPPRPFAPSLFCSSLPPSLPNSFSHSLAPWFAPSLCPSLPLSPPSFLSRSGTFSFSLAHSLSLSHAHARTHAHAHARAQGWECDGDDGGADAGE